MTVLRKSTEKNSNKHVPHRTCITCRKTGSKTDFVRLVNTSDGNIEIDEKGKKAGRGAYICKNRECWELTFVKNRKERLGRALKVSINAENRAKLFEYGKALPSVKAAVERN